MNPSKSITNLLHAYKNELEGLLQPPDMQNTIEKRARSRHAAVLVSGVGGVGKKKSFHRHRHGVRRGEMVVLDLVGEQGDSK